jgi:type I restriction-modification system DNA methylase subunit
MDKQQAQDIVRGTFESPFDKGRFIRFVKNLLNHIDESKSFPKPLTGSYIKESFRERIKSYDRIGRFIDASGKVIDILTVCLHREKSIAQARTSQRNFVSGYLRGDYGSSSSKDAAIVAFYCDDTTDWRFSLVTIDHVFDVEKLRVKQEFSSAKRFSFLVGENESSHTAQSKLYPIIADDEHNPTLTGLEEAFNIEKVTKEFFGKYRDLFLRTKETLDEVVAGDTRIKADFEAKGVNAIDFAKKLLGQIVFLYFLQKKGWFGVARDADWGTGTKHFLRELFDGRHSAYKNFFNDILEPLFYEALRIDRNHDDGYYSRFNCKIPFLNGGLFDPINNYDWVHTDIILPNDLFSNDFKTKEGDKGNGILDIFDRYNFTVKEDEPLEKEVAVDPEMLGKVFENLLEVKDRKSKGTYYTPREIVHYMCQQSLINYLATELSDCHSRSPLSGNPVPSKEDLETLIKYGEQVGENEAAVVAKGRETNTYYHKLSESIRQNAALIDEKLANIKVCDPAIGSGAFPMGMMSEIVKTRNVLSAFIKNPHRTIYTFKRECIEKSLYGVDIDPGAVEIAKLRLWLSLVVDEDDIKQIKPLPNLDYKIVCGNSLSGVNMMFHHQTLVKLEDLKVKLFEETNPTKKASLKVEIDSLISEITHNDKHFDFKIYFSEVFNPSQSPLAEGGSKGGGFDIVIANPPYVRHEAIKDIKPELKKQFGDFFCGTADIYTYFYKKGVDLLRVGGHLCFIAPNKFMRAGYGKNTRALLTTEAMPKVVIDFCDLPIFDATTYPSVILVEKNVVGARSSLPHLGSVQSQGGETPPLQDKFLAATFSDAAQLERLEETLSDIGFFMPISALREEGWNLERPAVLALMEKLRKTGKSLGEYVQGRFYRGVLTGLNEAFVIDAATRERLIAEDSKSAELIKPWVRGRDIKKWKAEWAGPYVIFTRRGVDIDKYSAIKRHLEKFRQDLEPKKSEKQKRGRKPGPYKWYEIQDNIAYYEDFEKPKIIYPDIAKAPEFTWDESKSFLGNTAYIIPTDETWLLGLLNSKLIWWLYLHISSTIQGGFVRFIAQYMEQLPITSATVAQKASIIERVQAILANPDSPDVPRLEAEINNLVYALYGLTPDEIAIVEGMDKKL